MPARDTFTAIADPTRRQILQVLLDSGDLSAGQIAARFSAVSRPGVSRHLRVLRECGLVRSTHSGRQRRYRLDPAPLSALRDGWLAGFADAQVRSLQTLRQHIENTDER